MSQTEAPHAGDQAQHEQRSFRRALPRHHPQKDHAQRRNHVLIARSMPATCRFSPDRLSDASASDPTPGEAIDTRTAAPTPRSLIRLRWEILARNDWSAPGWHSVGGGRGQHRLWIDGGPSGPTADHRSGIDRGRPIAPLAAHCRLPSAAPRRRRSARAAWTSRRASASSGRPWPLCASQHRPEGWPPPG
jgi:hypothetical protein